MNAGELLDFLATQPRDRPVILAPGNRHSPLAEALEGRYKSESGWAGEVYLDGDGWEAPDDAVPAVILEPMN